MGAERQTRVMTPIVSIDNIFGVSKAVDVDWFASEITISKKLVSPTFPVFHILAVSLPSTAVLNLMRSGNQTVTEKLNEGIALSAGCLYRLTIPLVDGDTYNLQYTGIAGPQDVTVRIIETSHPGA